MSFDKDEYNAVFGLKIASINIDGLYCNKEKRDKLNEWLICNDIDILCIQEWYKHYNNDTFKKNFPTHQFTNYRIHNSNYQTAILYKDGFSIHKHEITHKNDTKDDNKLWRTWITIYSSKSALNLGSIYSHDDENQYDGR